MPKPHHTTGDHNICQIGLLNAFLLDGRGGAETLSWSGVQDWHPSHGRLWVHMDYSAAKTTNWLLEHSDLEPIIIEALISEESRPRALSVGDGLFLSLRGVNSTPEATPVDMISLRIWADQHRIITTLKHPLGSVNDLIQHLHDGIGPTDSAALLIRLADELIMMMGDTVDELEDKIGELESLTLTADTTELKSELAALRRQTITIKRYLAPKREAMGRLLIERVSWLTPQHRMHLREVKDRLIRHIEDIDAVRERTAVAHEELLSRASEQLSERMYILAIVTAVFLPLGFFTGLLGVNLNGIPGSDSPYAFPAFALSLLCVLGMQFLYFKKRKWI